MSQAKADQAKQAVKMRMQFMAQESEYAKNRLEQALQEEEDFKEKIKQAENDNAQMRKDLKEKELEFDKVSEELTKSEEKMVEREKTAEQAELDVGTLTRRINLTENELEIMNDRLKDILEELSIKSKAADESERGRKEFEMEGIDIDDKMNRLLKDLEEAGKIAEEADKKYDEESRRYAIMEMCLEQVEDKADDCETKLAALEEELNIVAVNMKNLEISEQEALTREESYIEQIRQCEQHLKETEERADAAEYNGSSLQREVYRLETELEEQKELIQNIKDQLDETYTDLQEYE